MAFCTLDSDFEILPLMGAHFPGFQIFSVQLLKKVEACYQNGGLFKKIVNATFRVSNILAYRSACERFN